MELKVIAYAHNGHTDKFGIPRQSREESPILTRIVFEPEYSVAEALRGIEGYSHLWLIWGFTDLSPAFPAREGEWSPTVRPPRLGGNKRMGVFATRSPYRPNPIGLSSVKILTLPQPAPQGREKDERRKEVRNAVYVGESGRMELLVSGADLLDGTPIYDIKPYLSFSDSHPEAQNGFAEATRDYRLDVCREEPGGGGDSTASVESRDNYAGITRESRGKGCCFRGAEEWQDEWPEERTMRDIEYILSQDPRPGYQEDPKKEYKMDYAGWRVIFRVEGGVAYVRGVEKVEEKRQRGAEAMSREYKSINDTKRMGNE